MTENTKPIKWKADINIPTPSRAEVESYLLKWDLLENYTSQEKALNKLFHDVYPMNKNLDDILIKVASLNDFYSTNILSPYLMAKHIHELNIDDRLYAHDESLVHDIAKLQVKPDKVIHMYSFATKYCSHHQGDFYAINDYYVEEVLKYFRTKDKFYLFQNTDLKNYSKFLKIIKAFRAYYKLEHFGVKDIDRYIWQLGKEYFTREY